MKGRKRRESYSPGRGSREPPGRRTNSGILLPRMASEPGIGAKNSSRQSKEGGRIFCGTPECEEAFLKIKEQLGNPPMLAKPEDGETLILYLAVSEYSVSAVLVKEEASHQWPVYYVIKRLLDAETWYTNMEKLVYALILAAQKLRPYFQAHRIEVRTAYPLRHILHKPESSRRMLKWAVELGQLDLEYCPRTAIKGQALADFILEFDAEVNDKAIVLAEPSSQRSSQDEKRQELPHPWWILHVDGAVNNNGSGVGIVLITPEGHRLMSAIHFKFYVTNNDDEYEALINGLKLALEVGAMNLIVRSDSELVVNQINGGFQARGPRTELYMRCAQCLLNFFSNARLESISREENSNADALAKMGSQMDSVQLGQILLGIQEIPSIPEVEVLLTQEVPRESWMTPIHNYIQTGAVPKDKLQALRLRYQAAKYVEYDGILYKRGFNQPLLRCVDMEEGNYILREVHEGICGNHSGVVRWH
ncbi:uncharacterized protein LOC141709030 [Apium graveolens]|uniref:uncharacterized protein LOC141709030 n=1 Tax=Apium graveolens TaxID=4045 RepID=UPI003D78DA1B